MNQPAASAGPVRYLSAAYPGRPGLDTALSRALLLRVSAGVEGETLRLYVPDDVVAFGKRDTVASGYPAAVAAARRHGFEAVERLAGGRAAVFSTGTVAFAWTVPDSRPAEGIRARFAHLAGILAAALGDVGAAATVGEVPGEYCPGEFSVNADGRIKLAGIGQRLGRAAAHVGGVVVVSGADRVRDVLVPVYAALGLDWRPDTAGALEDEVPGVSTADVIDAIARRFADHSPLIAAEPNPELLDLAVRLEDEHLSPH